MSKPKRMYGNPNTSPEMSSENLGVSNMLLMLGEYTVDHGYRGGREAQMYVWESQYM